MFTDFACTGIDGTEVEYNSVESLSNCSVRVIFLWVVEYEYNKKPLEFAQLLQHFFGKKLEMLFANQFLLFIEKKVFLAEFSTEKNIESKQWFLMTNVSSKQC